MGALRRFCRLRWLLVIALAGVVLLPVGFWAKSNYWVWFDDHRVHQDAHFGHWLLGWFRNWEDAPLQLVIYEGPDSFGYGDYSPSVHLWYLKKLDESAELLFSGGGHNEGASVVLFYLPKSERLGVYKVRGSGFGEVEVWLEGNRLRSGDQPVFRQKSWVWMVHRPPGELFCSSQFFSKEHSVHLSSRSFKVPREKLRSCSVVLSQSHSSDVEVELAYDRGMDGWRLKSTSAARGD